MQFTDKIVKAVQKFYADKRGIQELAGLAIGILVLIVIVSIIPMVGQKVDDAAGITAGGDWDSASNTNLVNGSSLWEDTGSLITLAAIVAIIGVLLSYIFVFQGKTGGQGGM